MTCQSFGRTLILAFCLLMSLEAFSETYTINPGDLVRIDVWNEDSLSREILVTPDGMISLPMAGEINTKGLSSPKVAEKISKALGKYMKDTPRVVVSIVNVNGNKVYVIGKVVNPGAYVITSDTDVMQALALAGGLNAFAAENDIQILRRQPDGRQISIPFRYAKVKAGHDLDTNIVLRSRDLVVVP